MRVRRLLLAALLVLLVVGLAYGAWSLVQVRSALVAARADADRLQGAIETGDTKAAQTALSDLQQHANAAEDRSDGPLFTALGWLPVVGDDVEGVQLVSRALADVSEDGLPPLVDTAGDVSAGAFLPQDGRLPLNRITRVQRPVGTAAAAFTQAAETLAEGDPDEYVDQLAAPYEQMQTLVDDGANALTAARTATRLLPGMLGADGERRYVAIFQNNAELRTTGGLPGAAALVTASDGRIEMGRQTESLPKTERPILPESPAERELYDGQLGTYYQDANFIPHFPRTAELVAAHWERNFDEQVDGVVSFDPVMLSYLLAGTGPVTVAGTEVSGSNAIDLLLHETYQRLGPDEQDAFYAEVARLAFEKLAAGEGDPRTVLEALARGVREGRLIVTSFHEDEQEQLGGTRIAGEMAAEGDESQLGVYLNDATMSKLNYFLDYEVEDIAVESCQDGVQTLRGRLRLHSSAPAGGAGLTEWVLGQSGQGIGKRGDQLIQVELHAPQGGKVRRIDVDGKKRPVWPETLLDHHVAQTFVEVRPGGENTVEFVMTAPADVTEINVRVTPGVEAENESSLASVGCG